MHGTNPSGEGGRRACHVTPGLSYGRKREKKAEIKNEMEKNETKQNKKHGNATLLFAVPKT